MTLKLHNVPAMPTLAMLGDNGGVVTVNPEWCDWYELVFGVPAGEGYIKGREIMQQIDGTFSEFIGQRTEAMKSAIHLMMADDPNSPSTRYRSIKEARSSFTLVGKHAMDYNHKNEEFTFDGYFSVTDLEAILFIHRAEELIEKAKKHFGGFFGEAGAKTEELDVNQLMQVMTPGRQVTDIDSEIFATPVAESPNRAYMFPKAKASPMAEQFDSVVEAHATLAESGILRKNVVRTPGENNLVLDGYFTPKDLEALLYLYRNNDPMVFPEKDANGLPKDDNLGLVNRKTFMELLGVTKESSSEEVATALRGARVAIEEHFGKNGSLPNGLTHEKLAKIVDLENAPNPSIEYIAGPRSIWNSLSGSPAPEGFNVTPPEMSQGDTLHRTHVTSASLILHVAYDIMGDQAFYVCDRRGNLIRSDREPAGTRSSLRTGNDVLNRLITEGGGLRRGEWPGVVAAVTPAEKSLVKPDDSPERLDVTGRPLPKFIITDAPGGNAVEKNLSVLRDMDTDDFSNSLDWIIKGYPLSEEDDQRFIGFTLNDFVKVASERIKRLQSEIMSGN
jgi:hypothetical protein